MALLKFTQVNTPSSDVQSQISHGESCAYSVGLSQLHGKDSLENTIKTCSLGVLERKNIKAQTAANSFILCSLWKVNAAYGEFSSRYKWLKKTTGEISERKREKLWGPRKTTEITVSKPPVHFEVNLFHF